MAVDIVSDDLISRCIIYARAFDGEVHVNSRLWPFGASGEDGAAHESGVLRRLAADDIQVHRIGCQIAAGQNAAKGEPPSGPNRRYYCGFRTARCGDLLMMGEGYHIVLTNVAENGEESHVDIALFITVEGKNARANRRTDAGLSFAEAFGPAVPFVCECDSLDDHHPINRFGVKCLAGPDQALAVG